MLWWFWSPKFSTKSKNILDQLDEQWFLTQHIWRPSIGLPSSDLKFHQEHQFANQIEGHRYLKSLRQQIQEIIWRAVLLLIDSGMFSTEKPATVWLWFEPPKLTLSLATTKKKHHETTWYFHFNSSFEVQLMKIIQNWVFNGVYRFWNDLDICSVYHCLSLDMPIKHQPSKFWGPKPRCGIDLNFLLRFVLGFEVRSALRLVPIRTRKMGLDEFMLSHFYPCFQSQAFKIAGSVSSVCSKWKSYPAGWFLQFLLLTCGIRVFCSLTVYYLDQWCFGLWILQIKNQRKRNIQKYRPQIVTLFCLLMVFWIFLSLKKGWTPLKTSASGVWTWGSVKSWLTWHESSRWSQRLAFWCFFFTTTHLTYEKKNNRKIPKHPKCQTEQSQFLWCRCSFSSELSNDSMVTSYKLYPYISQESCSIDIVQDVSSIVHHFRVN